MCLVDSAVGPGRAAAVRPAGPTPSSAAIAPKPTGSRQQDNFYSGPRTWTPRSHDSTLVATLGGGGGLHGGVRSAGGRPITLLPARSPRASLVGSGAHAFVFEEAFVLAFGTTINVFTIKVWRVTLQ